MLPDERLREAYNKCILPCVPVHISVMYSMYVLDGMWMYAPVFDIGDEHMAFQKTVSIFRVGQTMAHGPDTARRAF